MLQNPCKTLGFKKNMVYKIPPGGGGKPYPASGLKSWSELSSKIISMYVSSEGSEETLLAQSRLSIHWSLMR